MSDLYENLRAEADRISDEWVAHWMCEPGLSMRERELIPLVGRMVAELSVAKVLEEESARVGS